MERTESRERMRGGEEESREEKQLGSLTCSADCR